MLLAVGAADPARHRASLRLYGDLLLSGSAEGTHAERFRLARRTRRPPPPLPGALREGCPAFRVEVHPHRPGQTPLEAPGCACGTTHSGLIRHRTSGPEY